MPTPSKETRRGGANHIVFMSYDGTAWTTELTLNNVTGSPAARQADGTYQVSIAQDLDNEALEEFLEEFRVEGAAGASQSTVYEDGYEDVEPAGSDIPYLYIFRYGAPDRTDTPKRKVFVAKGYIDATSGSDSQGQGSRTNPTIVFKSVKETTTGGLSLTTAEFEATLVTPAAKALPEGSTGKNFYLAKA